MRTVRSFNSPRNAKGSMLVLTMATIGLCALGLVIGLSFCGLYFVHNWMQHEANEIALSGAYLLNKGDYQGRLNNFIGRARELVCDSRGMVDQASSEAPQLVPLAEQLLDEARQSAVILEQERVKLKNASESEAHQAMADRYMRLYNIPPLSLPWIQLERPQLISAKLGQIKETQSNVSLPGEGNDVQFLDESGIYKHTPSNLYKANINARLAGSDSDLDFKLSSLPASVDKEINPARVALRDAFEVKNSADLQSAAQVTLNLKVKTIFGAATANYMRITGTAAAIGAGALP